MEKRRNVSLGALLWRYLILTGVSAAALAAAWWITLMLLMNAGFVLPARTQSDHASDAAAAMRLQGSFDASLADELCNYVYFAPDGTVLETNLSGRRLADAKEARRISWPPPAHALRRGNWRAEIFPRRACGSWTVQWTPCAR